MLDQAVSDIKAAMPKANRRDYVLRHCELFGREAAENAVATHIRKRAERPETKLDSELSLTRLANFIDKLCSGLELSKTELSPRDAVAAARSAFEARFFATAAACNLLGADDAD